MHEISYKSGWLTRRVWVVPLIAVVLVGVLAGSTPPSAHAEDPLGNCWGGVLSAEPLQCYILEQAQSAGVIDVDAVYESPNKLLYVYVSHPAPIEYSVYVGDDVGEFFKEKAAEFVEQSPGQVFFDHVYHQACAYGSIDPADITPYADASAEDRARYKSCVLNLPGWSRESLLPFPRTYQNIEVRTGGADAVRGVGGWASFRQLWPPMDVTERAGEPGPLGKFDVSDVDTVNLPEMDCGGPNIDDGCYRSKRFPDLGIAGWISRGGKIYVQIEASPSDEARIEAAKEVILDDYGLDDQQVITIPVPYSYEELWRWATILNRFALSSGNTLGITYTVVGLNRGAFASGPATYPLPELREAEPENYLTYRTTINVWSQKPRETVDALPQLLGQLNIPFDAVGVVVDDYVSGPFGPSFPVVGVDLLDEGAEAVPRAVDDRPWLPGRLQQSWQPSSWGRRSSSHAESADGIDPQ